ncbi:hypothetical protein [Planctomicrobium piriforme]|uniref:Iron reductase n=1 Tax=Planctomicrobium piriforme TaxID=1576369 RepID=A0A1I3GK88_9PLAN|nr:hypothetical protein [Planctomicrobium piriforme]SFI23621.1 hypothetical protein SAMN05421753_10722 [Planctomicrobium piriforme]
MGSDGLQTVTAPLSAGELAVLWTVRLSLVCFWISLELRMLAAGREQRLQAARLFWTVGYVAFVVHFLTAFHFVHHWSHADAFAVTARRTAQTVGMPFGAGIYVNHLFLVVWGIDVVWWWIKPANYLRRARWMTWAILGFMVFIAFHATVTFGQGPIRWWGLAGTLCLAGSLAWTALRRPGEMVTTARRTL